MKKLLVGCWLFCCSVGTSESQVIMETVVQAPSETGWLKLTSNELIGKVWIDSLEFPVVKGLLFQVPAGKHSVCVRFTRPELWNHRDWQDTVLVAPGDTLRLVVSPVKWLTLQSDPSGASVEMDSMVLGTTPLLVPDTIFYTHTLRIRKPGFRDTTLTVSFPGMLHLNPDSTELSRIQFKSMLRLSTKRKYQRLAMLTFGTGVLSGLAALWLKAEANRNYDRYLGSGNPAEMQKYFDNSIRYDHYAAAAYLVFQTNLVVSAYLFFRQLLMPQS